MDVRIITTAGNAVHVTRSMNVTPARGESAS